MKFDVVWFGCDCFEVGMGGWPRYVFWVVEVVVASYDWLAKEAC